MAVPYTLIGGDSKPEPTIDDIFAVLTSNLYLIKSCRIKSVNELKININANVIRAHIFRFQGIALSYLDASLQSITDIKSLGDKVVSNIKKDIIEELDDVSDEQNRDNAMSIINSAIENTEAELISLRDELIERSIQLETAIKDKIKFNMSIAEIAALFRGMEEADIFERKHTQLSRIIAQNFTTKVADDVKINNLKNNLDAPTGGAIDSVLTKLRQITVALHGLKEK